jgi:hypothetical protein
MPLFAVHAQADLTAFTTARVMQDALRSGRRFDIPVGTVRSLAADQLIGSANDNSASITGAADNSPAVLRPSWLDDPNERPGDDADAVPDFDIEHSDPMPINIVEGSESQPPTGTIQASAGAAASWGLDRIDQVDLPLNNRWSSDYDGRGVHSESGGCCANRFVCSRVCCCAAGTPGMRHVQQGLLLCKWQQGC